MPLIGLRRRRKIDAPNRVNVTIYGRNFVSDQFIICLTLYFVQRCSCYTIFGRSMLVGRFETELSLVNV